MCHFIFSGRPVLLSVSSDPAGSAVICSRLGLHSCQDDTSYGLVILFHFILSSPCSSASEYVAVICVSPVFVVMSTAKPRASDFVNFAKSLRRDNHPCSYIVFLIVFFRHSLLLGLLIGVHKVYYTCVVGVLYSSLCFGLIICKF